MATMSMRAPSFENGLGRYPPSGGRLQRGQHLHAERPRLVAQQATLPAGCLMQQPGTPSRPVLPLHVHARSKSLHVDVTIVGAGIIGLLIAETLLRKKLSVALVERKQLCSGATGAGQGYLWMAHRSPNTLAWDLASCSTQEWKRLVAGDAELRTSVEWQDVGSLLLSSSEEEQRQLADREGLLRKHGVEARSMSHKEVARLEPALAASAHCGGLLVETDAQISGRRAAHTLLSRCKSHPGLHLMLEQPVERLVMSPSLGASTGAETSDTVIHSRLGTVVASGVWSGGLLASITGQPRWSELLQPRRGHLIEVARPAGMPAISRGIMETSYTKHYASTAGAQAQPPEMVRAPAPQAEASQAPAPAPAPGVDITFTATTSSSGSLLIGSSREFSGWSPEPSEAIVTAIMRRASLFLPALGGLELPQGDAVRVGLRPYAVGGLPIIGPIPGHPGLLVAAGHEGSGLCLGPATAMLTCAHLLHGHGLAEDQSVKLIDSFRQLLPDNRLA